jgi:hypothetical protein
LKKYIYYTALICLTFLLSTGVRVNAQELKITSPKKTIYIKQKIQLKVTPKEKRSKLKWKSSNNKIAVVSKLGIVSGRHPGKVKIYVSLKKEKSIKAVLNINVKRFNEKKVLLKEKFIVNSYEIYQSLKTFKIFHSKKEIKDFTNSAEKKIYPANIQRKLSKKLLSYKKKFFNSKSVCLVYIGDDVKGFPRKVNFLKVTQNKKGNIIGNLKINTLRKNPGESYPQDVDVYFAIFELSNKDANDIQYFKVSRNYY